MSEMRVRTVDDLGTDAIYLRPHEMLLIDSACTEWEREELVRRATAKYRPRTRLRLVT